MKIEFVDPEGPHKDELKSLRETGEGMSDEDVQMRIETCKG